MTLQQVLWAITALGAFLAAVGAAVLVRDRGGVREPGMALTVTLTGVLLSVGGFLLSIPRYAGSLLVIGIGLLAGLPAGLIFARAGSRRTRPARGGRPGGR